MRSCVRLLISVFALVVVVVVLASKQPPLATANSQPERRGASRCLSIEEAKGAAATVQAVGTAVFAPGVGARLPWDDILSPRATVIEQLLKPAPESFASSAITIFGLPNESALPVSRNPLAPAQTVDVFVSNFQFDPDPVNIKAGDTVRWTWNASLHTVTSGTPCTADNVFCSPSNVNCASNPVSSTGSVYSHTFNTPGSFPYFCRVHCSIGMTGTINVDPAPSSSTVQFSVANYNVNEGGGPTIIAVTRSGDTSGTSSVDYQTNDNFAFVECNVNDGLANQRCDYITTAGTLNFAANETSKTFSIPIIDDFQVEGNETLNLSLSSPVGGTLGSQNTAVLTISDNDTTVPATRLFVAQLNGAQETPPNTSTATGLGTLLLSNDEMSAQVNLSFNGLSSAQTAAHIHGPAHVEVAGPIVFPLATGSVNNQTISLTATQVAQLKAGLFYFNVHTNNFPNGEIRGQILPNPLENARFFVRQQYYDFQNREPDQVGFDYWTNDQIISCGADLICITVRRVVVADAFFFEPEFQQTGSYGFRLYRAAYGNLQPRPNPEIPQLPSYVAFIQDRARVVGGGDLAQKQLALANAFGQRAEFLAKYPASLSGPQFVDALLATILTDSGANLSSQRDTLIAHFNTGSRGLVLFHLANDYWNGCGQVPAPCVPPGFGPAVDNRPFLDAEYNRGFVATMYFGFLRRDADIGGYGFWLGQVNSFLPLRSTTGQHKMVCGALITSQEYQQRFSAYFPRSDAECGPVQ